MGASNFGQRRPALILLAGLPGTGKTTFARALAAALTVDQLESDAIRRAMFAVPDYTPEESGRVFAAIESRVAEALTAGRNVLLDATNVARSDRRRFLALARRVDAALVCVRLTVPEGVARQRLGRPRSGHSQADKAIYDLMRGRAEPFEVAVVTVDTRFDLAPSVRLVLKLVAAATA